MALKLKGIDPRPPGPRPAAVAVETLPTSDEELIRFWRPQASAKARKGESEFTIARFLHSKGVEGLAARAAAKEIIEHPDAGFSPGIDLSKPLGWFFLLLGLLIPIVGFIYDVSGVIMLLSALMAVMLGCKLLWEPPDSGGPGTLP